MPGELKVLLFLKSMTLGNGNAEGHYTIAQIIDGMVGWSQGTNLSRRGVQNAIDSLEKRGLIAVKTWWAGGFIFAINPDWSPTGTNVIHDGNVATLKAGRQPRKAVGKPRSAGNVTAESSQSASIDEAVSGAKFAEGARKICLLPKKDVSQEQTLPFHSEMVAMPTASRSPLPVKNEEDFTGKKIEENPKAPLSPAAAKPGAARPLTGNTLERAWKAAWRAGQASGDILPTCIPAPWSPRDKKAVKQLAAKWDETAHGPFTDFLTYIVTHWKPIMRAKFWWMSAGAPPPSLPSVQFLANHDFFREVLEAFCDQTTTNWMGTPKDTAHLISSQMQNGLSREAAILKVARTEAVVIDREQRAQDITTAKRHYEMAELALSRARKEAYAREKYRPGAQPAQQKENFALQTERDANEPIILEQADFSAWDLN